MRKGGLNSFSGHSLMSQAFGCGIKKISEKEKTQYN